MSSVAEKKLKKLRATAAKKLIAAGEALNAYRMACIECGDMPATHDRRKSLTAELLEYGHWLEPEPEQPD
jgi:hypothetical protein